MLNLDGLDEEKINKLQSHIRKNHVKNEMLKVRDEYEKIFYEIEGPNSDTKLEWPSKENTICLPKFVSKRSTGREQITDNNTSNKSGQLIKDTKEVNSSTAAKSQDNELVLRTENKPSGGGVESEIDFEQIKYLQLENLKNMDKNELLSIREGISLELLWIEQAIQSRVQYLKLKKSIQQQKNQKKLTSSQ